MGTEAHLAFKIGKRAKKLDIDVSIRKTRGKINVIVDSTGLKVFGEGEWKTRTHGKSKQPRLERDEAIRDIRK